MKTNLQKKERAEAMNTDQLTHLVIDSISDKKGQAIVKLDLRNLTEAVCDHFVICEGGSPTQVKAIADHIEFKVKNESGELPLHREGFENLEWVLLDYFDVVVHIFQKDRRDFYQLEDLWSDAEITSYDDNGVELIA